MARFWRRARTERIGRHPRLCVAAHLTLAVAAGGQNIDLGNDLHPPHLEGPTYAHTLALALEDEIATLQTQVDAAPADMSRWYEAQRNVRIIAADLLTYGDTEGPRGTPAIFAGVTLAHGRAALDDAFMGAAADPQLPDQATATVSAIDLFNAECATLRDYPGGDFDQLDRWLATALSPIEPIVARSGVAVRSHWIGADHAIVGRTAHDAPPIHELEMAVHAANFSDGVRADFVTILDRLREGEAFPRLRRYVMQCRGVLGPAIDHASVVRDITWLSDDDRVRFDAYLLDALRLFRTPADRAAGIERLGDLAVIRETASGIGRFEQRVEPLPPPIVDAFRAAAGLDATGRLSVGHLNTLGDVVSGMTRARTVTGTDLDSDFRSIHRQLHRLWQESERHMLTHLVAAVSPHTNGADSAAAAVVDAHRRPLADLLRLHRVSGWVETIELIEPDAARPFRGQCRRWCQWLTEPARHDQGEAALELFEQQLAPIFPFPFESELRGRDPAAIRATGAQSRALLETLQQERRLWAMAWSLGVPDASATRRVRLLQQLCRTMADTAGVFRLADDASALNRWSGWEIESSSLSGALARLPSRLKLATHAAIDGSDDEMAHQLARMSDDEAVARLLARLATLLADRMETLSDGAAATLGQLIHAPDDDAFLIDARYDLAEFCRYAMEEAAARRAGNAESAEAIRRFLENRAQRLLERVPHVQATMPS